MDTALEHKSNADRESPRASPPSPHGSGRALPRWQGHPLVGHLDAFRRDRAGLLLRAVEKNKEAIEMPMGPLWRAVGIMAPALANEVLVTKHKAFRKSPGLAVFLRPV